MEVCHVRVLVALIGALLLAGVGCSGEEPLRTPTQFFVGYAEADVTPPIGTIMGGYGPPGGYRRSTGTHDPIMAQVAIIANDAPQAFVYITMDTVGYFHDFGDWGPGIAAVRQEIVKKIGKQFRMTPEHIVLASTHSHSGPDLTGFWQQTNQGPDLVYLNTLLEAIPAAAKEAADGIRPGTVHYVMTELVGYSGRSEDCSDVLDNSVAVMQARDAAGTPVFTIANYAKHPTSLGSSNTLFSGDYIWGFREEILARTGAPGLYMQGGIAAVHGGPLGPSGADEWESTYDMGRILADAVQTALPSLQQSQSVEIRHAYATTMCQLKSELVKTLIENADFPKRFWNNQGTELWADEVPISWHQVGDAEFASYPGEATPELSLLSKTKMVSQFQFLVGLGNDEIGYLIDKESIAKDTSGRLEGYELTMGLGEDGGQCVWDAHTALGWFDGALAVP
ncbi:MAG: neutral/alkaline non-lysosomal ceramidase N-terminal domain-containing protein [Deltaproteobacteria bacterium]|nr:neutral/alkaline non-lysosomal ceramidase N-terminal domain-containing protein [Deltaproteobacteria bacterium]